MLLTCWLLFLVDVTSLELTEDGFNELTHKDHLQVTGFTFNLEFSPPMVDPIPPVFKPIRAPFGARNIFDRVLLMDKLLVGQGKVLKAAPGKANH